MNHTNFSRLQEIIMIPVILVVIVAAFKLHENASRLIAVTVVLCQLVVHIMMGIKPFKCNPNEGKICNAFALLAGLILFFVFMKAMCVYKQINIYTIVAILAALYSIISHIVHIPMNAIIYKIIASR